MKSQTLSALAALATSLHLATATRGLGWAEDIPGFSCPSNTNNECSSSQEGGWDFGDLASGPFSSYNDFSFSGFTCSDSFGKRDNPKFPRRSSGKCISGTASSDHGSSPQFSCGGSSGSGSSSSGSKDISAFSISTLHVTTEFDCDLEFHYGMSDGSTCKQRSSCSSGGSHITNSQCGGAKNVTVVYPSTGQTNPAAAGKDSCSIGISSIGFDCSPASATQHPSTSAVIKTTSSVPSEHTSVESSTLVFSSSKITPVESIPSATGTSYTFVGTGPTKSSSIIGTSVKSSSSAETNINTSAKPSSATSIIGTSVYSSPAGSAPGSSATSIIGTYVNGSSTAVQLITSTIYATSVSTIISCAETVTDCPARSTVLTTVIIPVSTTICPVTATEVPGSLTASSPAASTGSAPSSYASSIIGTSVGTAPVSSDTAVPSVPCVSSGVLLSGQTACPVSSGSAPSSEASSIIGTSVGTAPVSSHTITPATSPATTAYTTVVVQESTTICPVTLTHTTGGVTSFETTSTTSTVLASSTIVVTAPTSAPSSSAEGVISVPAPSATSVQTTAYTTVVIQTSTTVCPVTLTHTTGGVTSFETTSTTSTVFASSTVVSSIAVTVTAPVSSVQGVTPTPSASTPTETAPCPDVLPQCLNTWMFLVGCKTNTDSDCYCPNESFVSNVFECLSAYGASAPDIDDAQKYFQGICAPYVSTNPAIVTAAPPIYTPAAPSAAATSTSSAEGLAPTPVTTVTLVATIVVPCTESSGSLAGSTIPSSSTTTTISTALVVPQVVFSTAPAAGSGPGSVALVPGTTPASQAAAYTTPAAPSPPTPSGVAGATNIPPSPAKTTSPVEFTGNAIKSTSSVGGLIAAALIAILAL
ncbi:hypothetical protein DSL72_009277 [Monilinia vaccinii-corymbosi]|uniref:CFEM domain-containing protein n=1 Tax=Monilinia vaccinii-corymbosi TaxID=61207 RepID=A0A8A3PQB0_9HELO|nr:hypothetical protein DSL72_009277 [Monilinia vaccinii-corymbosi]